MGSEHFLKLSLPKFAPRLRARAMWKSKSLKTDGLGRFKVLVAWQAQGIRQLAKYVAGAGVREGCKNVGRRGGVEEGLKRCVSRGRRAGISCFVMSMFEAPDAESVELRVAHFMSRKLLCSDHFAWHLQEFVCLGSTFSWQAQYFWSIHLKILKMFWNSDVKCLVNMSFLKEVP